MKWFDTLFPPRKLVLENGKIVMQRRSRAPLIVLAVIVATVISIDFTGFDLQMLLRRGYQFFYIIGQMIPPNWSYMPNVWGPLLDTIKMSLFGSMLGAVAAVPTAVLASSNMMKNRLIPAAMKSFISVMRTLPSLVTALVATFIFGLGTLAGTAAIFIFTTAYVGKLLYEQIETCDMQAFEAMEALGMNRLQSFRYAILPQVLPVYLSTSMFCFEGNVRYAAILGYVGAGGIGLILDQGIGWRNYANVGVILLMLIITVYLIESVSEHFRKKLV